MSNRFPITPPPELIKKWSEFKPMSDAVAQNWAKIATQAAQWGADQELEACIEWVSIQLNCTGQDHLIPHLRDARRPEPPELTDEEIPGDYAGYEKGFAQEHLARLMRDAIGTETSHNAYIVAAGKILDRPEFAYVARYSRPTPQSEPEGRSSDDGYEAGSMWAGHPMQTRPPANGEVAEVLQWPAELSRKQRAQEAEMLCCSAGMTPGKEMQQLVQDARDGMPLQHLHDLISHAIPTPQPPADGEVAELEDALLIRDAINQLYPLLAMTKEPDFRALCAKLMDRWTTGKDYWSVLAEIQSALAYDPRNDLDYDSYEYATEPIPYDTTWAQAAQAKAINNGGMEGTL